MLLPVPGLVLLRFGGYCFLHNHGILIAHRSVGKELFLLMAQKVEVSGSQCLQRQVRRVPAVMHPSIFGNSACILNLVNKESYICSRQQLHSSHRSSFVRVTTTSIGSPNRAISHMFLFYKGYQRGCSDRSTCTALSSANRPCAHPAPAQLPMTWSVFSTTSLPPAFPSSLSLPLAWS